MPAPSNPEMNRFALWNLGFRPFYLLAGFFASLSMLGWAGQFAAGTGMRVYSGDPRWHAHEMIFGFAFAVMVGFLFTAARTWTNRPTPTGIPLAAIAALWLAARVLALASSPLLAAAADAAFAIAVTAGLAVPLVASGNRRNYFFIAIMLGLGALSWGIYTSIKRKQRGRDTGPSFGPPPLPRVAAMGPRADGGSRGPRGPRAQPLYPDQD